MQGGSIARQEHPGRRSVVDLASDAALRQELNTRFRQALISYFHRRVRDRSEAEDLTQEVFLRLIQKADISSRVTSDAYVYTVAANLLRDRARRAFSRRAQAHVSLDQESDQAGTGLVDEFDPERILKGRESLQICLGVLARLDERMRNILVLFRLERLKQREIAEMYGMTVAAVEKQIQRATAHLAEEACNRARDRC